MSLLFIVHHFVNILAIIIHVLYFAVSYRFVVPMSVRAATGLGIVLPIMPFLFRFKYLCIVMYWLGVCRNDFFEPDPDPDITEENPVVPDPVPDV
jgi:hypothetical protein